MNKKQNNVILEKRYESCQRLLDTNVHVLLVEVREKIWYTLMRKSQPPANRLCKMPTSWHRDYFCYAEMMVLCNEESKFIFPAESADKVKIEKLW